MVLGVTDTRSIGVLAERAAALTIAEAVDKTLRASSSTEEPPKFDAPAPQLPLDPSFGTITDPALTEMAEISLTAARRLASSEAGALCVALKARRLIDEGRRRALEMVGFEATLLTAMVPHEVSVEATLLLARRTSSVD